MSVAPGEAPLAAPRQPAARPARIVLEPVSQPQLGPIGVDDTLFAIGRNEAPFDGYDAALVADLSRRHARIFCEGEKPSLRFHSAGPSGLPLLFFGICAMSRFTRRPVSLRASARVSQLLGQGNWQ